MEIPERWLELQLSYFMKQFQMLQFSLEKHKKKQQWKSKTFTSNILNLWPLRSCSKDFNAPCCAFIRQGIWCICTCPKGLNEIKFMAKNSHCFFMDSMNEFLQLSSTLLAEGTCRRTSSISSAGWSENVSYSLRKSSVKSQETPFKFNTLRLILPKDCAWQFKQCYVRRWSSIWCCINLQLS